MTDKTPVHASDAVAILHRSGPLVRGVIGRFGRVPAIIASQEFSADRPHEIRRWLVDNEAGSVIGVLPAAAVVCRTCTLPDAEPEQLTQALVLQAEAVMQGEVPPHRQARAVLPIAPGETARAGIMVAWPEHAGNDPSTFLEGIPEDAVPDDVPVMYAPDVAAIAALLNGQRPTGTTMAFDRRDGSVTLAVSHANGAVIRAARIPVDHSNSMANALRPLLAETALSVGHTPDFTQSMVDQTVAAVSAMDHNQGLLLPPELVESARQRLEGTSSEAGWWCDYGVAAGTFLAAATDLASLTALLREAPMDTPSLGRRLIEALSTPRTAARVVVTSAMIALLAPSAFAGLRLAVLNLKLSNVQQYVEQAQSAEEQLAVYKELKDEAWPMSKLLADLVCNIPTSIDVDQMRIRRGRNVSVTGVAKPDSKAGLSAQEVVATMQDFLFESGIFEDISPQWGDPNNFGAYEFTLTASVRRPYRRFRYPIERDFALWSYADQLYGDGKPPEIAEPQARLVENTDTVAASDPGAETTPPTPRSADLKPSGSPAVKLPATGNGSTPRNGTNGNGQRTRDLDRGMSTRRGDDRALSRGGKDRGVGGVRPQSVDIPEPLSDEQIEVMTIDEAMAALTHIAQARQTARLDDETASRLQAEFKKVKKHHSNLKRQAPRGGDGP